MSKSKLWVGISLIVFGAGLIFTNFFVGLTEVVKGGFEQAYAFPITFERLIAHSTPGFYLESKEKASLWIRMPDRQVENKDFIFYVTAINEAGETAKEMAQDFNLGYFRSSYGRGQFYRIGILQPKQALNGVLIYQSGGTWVPGHDAQLVLKKEQGMKISLSVAFGVLVGLTLVVLGVMRLNLKEQHE